MKRIGEIARVYDPGHDIRDVIRILRSAKSPVSWLTESAKNIVSFVPT